MHDTRKPKQSVETHEHPHERGPVSIDINNITVKYSDGTAPLRDISLHLNAGETVALIGSNGAGKTSLLLALVGILLPEKGSIAIGDVPVDKEHMLTVRRKVGLVFQNPDDQLFMPKIYDDIAFGPRNFGHGEEEVREKVAAVLSALGISHLSNRSSLKLSGGEKRVCAIASVLVMNPRVLLFDEPTAFLDREAKARFLGILAGLGQTRIIATHDPDFAKTVADRVVVLKDGRIARDSPASEGSVTLL
ncbi:MAG: energy-coupling factor ABC transporter ATP-binding protein [Clostridiales Family XIII bacterium]|jgi:cobalt/nickel transport system ATP-binding protein|nr:energy-coupling factor ABC transporter ATP-binding protein [Clostridiales Family XIII bacterium]